MTDEDARKLVEKYNYGGPTGLEHRLDSFSEALLYALVREYKPTSVLEFGVSYGGSACANIKALIDNTTPFEYIGFEMLPDLRQQAKDNIKSFTGYEANIQGKIEDGLDKILDGIDYVVIDTDHDLENCKWYIKNIFPKLKDGALVMIHDWSVLTNPEGKLDYTGGNFEEIKYLIELYRKGDLPLEKVYWTWDYAHHRGGQIATSIWRCKPMSSSLSTS